MRTRSFLIVFTFKVSHELQLGDTFYPRDKGWHFGVNTRRILGSTAVPPGGDPIHHPALPWAFTHEGPATVSLAAVHALVFLEVSSTEHSPCEATLIPLFTKPLGKQRDGCLLQGSGIGSSYSNQTAQLVMALQITTFQQFLAVSRKSLCVNIFKWAVSIICYVFKCWPP